MLRGREGVGINDILKSERFPEKKKESQFAWMLISVSLHIFVLFSFFLFNSWVFVCLWIVPNKANWKRVESVDYNLKPSTNEILWKAQSRDCALSNICIVSFFIRMPSLKECSSNYIWNWGIRKRRYKSLAPLFVWSGYIELRFIHLKA